MNERQQCENHLQFKALKKRIPFDSEPLVKIISWRRYWLVKFFPQVIHGSSKLQPPRRGVKFEDPGRHVFADEVRALETTVHSHQSRSQTCSV